MADIYHVTASKRGSAERTIVVENMADAVLTARRYMAEHNRYAKHYWQDRSKTLYGNQGLEESEWTVRLWRNMDSDEEITIAPLRVHTGASGWSLLVERR